MQYRKSMTKIYIFLIHPKISIKKILVQRNIQKILGKYIVITLKIS